MAYVNWAEVKETDFSTPYKTFLDLKDKDTIFLIDYRTLEIKEIIISNYSKKENIYTYKAKNLFEVEFNIKDTYDHIRIFDGNTYLNRVSLNYNDVYITTDRRIADIIISLIESRNNYQWHTLTGIFGSPMNHYAIKDVKLR